MGRLLELLSSVDVELFGTFATEILSSTAGELREAVRDMLDLAGRPDPRS